ncbi:TetR/AcrR family transcriptional regulator [Catenulispora yoronensis]|uniref:TetR/AcrR family transcriptional regulator n=1 Tax=Catenulispora yoronensis TaxID=450799 RepID=A0ABN2UWU8_9ACTN
MSRWPSNSRGRLAQAAMGMFAERGFDQTTVADIAARAGLTERTFFRHFSDKREVLFHGGSHLEEVMTAAVAAAPPDATPLAAVAAGVAAVGPAFEGGRTGSRLRQSIIETHPDLQEREAAKLCHLGLALAESLRARGVAEPVASLVADVGIAVFRAAFAQWLASEDDDIRTLIDQYFDELVKVAQSGL